jgi:hypothetical protein
VAPRGCRLPTFNLCKPLLRSAGGRRKLPALLFFWDSCLPDKPLSTHIWGGGPKRCSYEEGCEAKILSVWEFFGTTGSRAPEQSARRCQVA